MSELDRSRFEAYLFGWGDMPGIHRYLETCGPVTYVPMPQLAHYPWTYPTAVVELARQLRRHDIHVIHSALAINDVLAFAAATLAGVKVTICSIEGTLTPYRISPLKREIYRLGYQLALPRINHLVAISHATAADAADFLRLSQNRIEVIHPGISLANIPPRKPTIDRASGPCVGTMCRLEADKPVDKFLEALATLRRRAADVQCVIAGDGPRRAQLEGLSRSLGLATCVRFLGYVDPKVALSQMDIFAYHGGPNDGLPWVILEAMAAGLPVVSTSQRGIPEAVEHGTTGILVAPGAVDEFATAIASLAADPGSREAMGQAGRERVEREFSPHAESESFATLYASRQLKV